MRLADAAGEPFVALAPRFGLRQLTDELCADAGIDPAWCSRPSEIPTMEGLVAAGFGVAVVPVPRAERGEPTVAHVPLSNVGAKRAARPGLVPADVPLPPGSPSSRWRPSSIMRICA